MPAQEVFAGWVVVYFLVINIVNTEKRLLIFLLAYCLFNFKMSHTTINSLSCSIEIILFIEEYFLINFGFSSTKMTYNAVVTNHEGRHGEDR